MITKGHAIHKIIARADIRYKFGKGKGDPI